MDRWSVCKILLAVLLCPGVPRAGRFAFAQDANSFPVTVLLTAIANDGGAVDLDASQLSVEVAKRPAKILSLGPAKKDRMAFALVVDVSGSEAKNAEPIRKAAAEIFRELSARGGSGYLVVFNQGIAASKTPMTPDAAQADLDKVRFYGGTAEYDAMDEACTQILSRAKNPGVARRILVLLSDGEDDESHIRDDKVEEDAEREGISIFSMATARSEWHGANFLAESGLRTGGLAVLPHTVAGGVASLLAAIDGQWELRAEATGAQPQTLQSLKVETRQKGVHLSTPKKTLIP